jgi:hypothetical protein
VDTALVAFDAKLAPSGTGSLIKGVAQIELKRLWRRCAGARCGHDSVPRWLCRPSNFAPRSSSVALLFRQSRALYGLLAMRRL